MYFSLQFLLEQMKPDGAPLLEAQLFLEEPDVIFKPSMDKNDPESFHNIMEELLDGIFNMASLINRVDNKHRKSYKVNPIPHFAHVPYDLISQSYHRRPPL